MEQEQIQIQQKESIKLKKNTKGIYEWEIKLIGEETLINDATLKRLEDIDNNLKDKYLGENIEGGKNK